MITSYIQKNKLEISFAEHYGYNPYIIDLSLEKLSAFENPYKMTDDEKTEYNLYQFLKTDFNKLFFYKKNQKKFKPWVKKAESLVDFYDLFIETLLKKGIIGFENEKYVWNGFTNVDEFANDVRNCVNQFPKLQR